MIDSGVLMAFESWGKKAALWWRLKLIWLGVLVCVIRVV